MKFFFNLSMLNRRPTGVGIYSNKLKQELSKKLSPNFIFLYIKDVRLLSLYRIFWNIFILPLKVGKNTVYSFSSHGSPFIANQVITIHDLICLNFPKQHRFQYYYFRFILPSIIRSSKKIVVISEFTKSEVLKFYKVEENKIKVVYNGANILQYSPDSKTEQEFDNLTNKKPYFITVGASYEHKNIFNLLSAIKKFNNLNFSFIIIGKANKYGLQLRDYAKKNHMPNVIFLDYVSDQLLSKLYKEALCNIYISRYEGFGFPPLEAASLGTVSLVSNIPVMREVFSNSMIYVDPLSVDDICEKLQMISKCKFNLGLYKNQYPTLITKYSWNHAAEEIISIVNT
ncbi:MULTISPECIES: glycosyltransferase family 4 protein [Kaistella]|nr:glycosyltransferase family 1 protein [Kaistella treverensis]